MALGLPPGVMAMLVLLFSTVSGLGLGYGCIPNSDWTGLPSMAPLMRHVFTVFIVAVVFWFWALWNVFVLNQPDLGALSFAIAIAVCVHGCVTGAVRGTGPARQARLMPMACGIVAGNYALGLSLVSAPWTLQLYFAAGVAWWAFAGYLGFVLGEQNCNEHAKCQVEEEERQAMQSPTTIGAAEDTEL
mmetsp:Transcript_12532/g.24436  ORF Transcript_12532/g.24436 Transcript_12532/m.24436 type:complete len:188 (-) Transcript_12532:55-618(-)